MIAAVPTEPSRAHTDPPHSLDESDLRQFCALVSRGCSMKEAARYVGCALAEIRRERESNEWFRHKLARAKMKADLAPLRAMQRAMLKDWRAAAWFLERTQPEKFGRRNQRAFTQKQARALIKDLTSIIGEEVTSEIVSNRISARIEAAVRYATHAHNDTQRTGPELRRAMHHHEMKSPRYSPTLADVPTDLPAPKSNGTARSAPSASLPPAAPRNATAPTQSTTSTPRSAPKSHPPNGSCPTPPLFASGANPNLPPQTPPPIREIAGELSDIDFALPQYRQ